MAKLMVPLSGICHPSIERALGFVEEAWLEVVLLANENNVNRVTVKATACRNYREDHGNVDVRSKMLVV